MFSEYASRFLQQSNARLSFTQQDDQRSRTPLDRRRLASRSRYVQRPGMPGNPYQNNPAASQSRFPFASRLSRQDPHAPLFFSATDDFVDEDDGDEHEQEVADRYALQRSRQHFGPSHLTESSEVEDDDMERMIDGQDHDREESTHRGRPLTSSSSPYRDASVPESERSGPGSKGKSRLVDVNLASTINEEPSESLADLAPMVDSDRPAPFQTFKTGQPSLQSAFMPSETDEEARIAMPRPPSPGESVPPTVILPSQEPPKHDMFWASLFQICTFAMFAAFVLIWFHTSTPTATKPIGDSIYSAIRSSTNMLLWDTIIAVFVAVIWLAALRSYVKYLVYAMIITVPVILFAFSLYPLVNSFKGTYQGTSFQDKVMRWLSFVPFLAAAFWAYSVWNHRYSLARSISILEFSTKILVASPALIPLGFATLGVIVAFTWIWMLMFERIFLSGEFSAARQFVLDANSWWLGAFFVLQYLWTILVIGGVQRATTAATVSQWYFHRYATPQPTSQTVVRASLAHAVGSFFGTVCLSTFLSLLVRLPLIILPGRAAGLLNMCAYWIIPTSLATLTNPLTLTYAAIHSQPLGIASRGLMQLSFISRTTPGPRSFSTPPTADPLLPYRLAKHLLHATKYVMSLALGFGGWVRTAHIIRISDSSGVGLRGSLYAYVVGLIAATIGFAVLGAVENVVAAVLDAALICWASETGGRAEARFCREAGELFGNDNGDAYAPGGRQQYSRV